jgi:peptidoglycan/xylan/chitin deacetylase (PgdA/CDA1 family)
VAYALASTRAHALIATLAELEVRAVVVSYHRVVDDFAAEASRAIPALLTSRRMLEQQLDWIGRRFRFVSLDELGERLCGAGVVDAPMAAVTFDDGYRDVYEQALPVLQRKGIPAAVFVVTSLVGTEQPQVHDRLYLSLTRAFRRWPSPARALRALVLDLGLRPPGMERVEDVAGTPHAALVLLLRSLPRAEVDRVLDALDERVGPEVPAPGMLSLTWEMLARMQRAGMVIGSHTRTHAWLTRERPADVLEELRGSREEIERRLGTRVEHFAYPDGRFDRALPHAVAAAGYRFAYTTCTHRHPAHPLLTTPRRMLWEHSCLDARGRFSPAIMNCQMHGIFDLVSGCDQDHAR